MRLFWTSTWELSPTHTAVSFTRELLNVLFKTTDPLAWSSLRLLIAASAVHKLIVIDCVISCLDEHVAGDLAVHHVVGPRLEQHGSVIWQLLADTPPNPPAVTFTTREFVISV